MSKSSSHATEPLVINDNNLSRAWARIFLRILEASGTEISPLVLSINGFDDENRVGETPYLRSALDAALSENENFSIDIVASTIFPQRIWQVAGRNRKRLFHLYRQVFPRYVAMKKALNGRGLYFERLTMFREKMPCEGNQLEWILSQFHSRPGVRDSMFQAAIFDPVRDHVNNARVGFPCLQHLSFVPTAEGLVVNAFYATQYVFDKAYGNYLGLVQLGAFMAGEMGLRLARLNVMVGVAKIDGVNKNDPRLKLLVDACREVRATLERDSADTLDEAPLSEAAA